MAGWFEGKVALVTGAGSGIGQASAVAFAREGAKVVVADVVAEGGEKTVRSIRDAGGDAMFVQTDVSKAGEVEGLVNRTVETYGRLDCAHNNAGIQLEFEGGKARLTAEGIEDHWDRMFDVNLKGIWLCMRYEIPQMLKQQSGTIVNTSSTAGLIGMTGEAAYVASKHGVVGLTKTAALEYARAGVRINAVCPGVIRTPMMESILGDDPELEAQLIEQLEPIGRMGRPEEIAEAVVWLCSDLASFVTGHIMAVDGGLVAGKNM